MTRTACISILIGWAAMLAGACVHLELRVPTAEPAIGMARFTEPPDIANFRPRQSEIDSDRPDDAFADRVVPLVERLPESVQIVQFFSHIYKPNPQQETGSRSSMPRVENGEVRYVVEFPEAVSAIRDAAHESGRSVIAYMNPGRFARLHEETHTPGFDGDLADVSDEAIEATIAAALRKRDELGLDGIYLDGPLPAGSAFYHAHPERVLAAYERLRSEWPEAVIVQHHSGLTEPGDYMSHVDVNLFGEHGSRDYSPYEDTRGPRWSRGRWNVIDATDHTQFVSYVESLYAMGVWPTYTMPTLHTPGHVLRDDYPRGWPTPDEWDRENARIGVVRHTVVWSNAFDKFREAVRTREENEVMPWQHYVKKASIVLPIAAESNMLVIHQH